MENSSSQQSREQHLERRRQSSRDRRQKMSIEQRQQELSRRRANYRQRKDNEKQVESSCSIGHSPIPFQDLSNTHMPPE